MRRSRTLSHAAAAALWDIRRSDAVIIDMATLSPSRLENLLDRAELRELTGYPALDAIARAHPGHRGSAKLEKTLRGYDVGENLGRSELELRTGSRSRASTSRSAHRGGQ